MPTPSNTPATSTGGPEIQDPVLFASLTERQAMPQTPQAIAGLSKKQRLLVEKVGVLSRVRLTVKCKFKTAVGQEPVANVGFPQKLLQEIALQSNGVTGIIDCSGPTLKQRSNRVYRNPVSAVSKWTGKSAAGGAAEVGVALKASETFEVAFVLEVPVAHDMQSLIGSLLAQNEETQLSFLLSWASEEELVHGGKIEAFEGEVLWDTTVFSIGSTVVGKQEKTVLPDLSAFHGLLENSTNLVATGTQKAELVRTAGQLLCYTAAIVNKAGGQVQLSPAEWTAFKIEYGGNKDPLAWAGPPITLLEENAEDYDGALTVGGLTYLAVDLERDNTMRDLIVPESLTELKAVFGIPAAFVPEGAQIRTSQETLYPAV
jgi:hypothetical protein